VFDEPTPQHRLDAQRACPAMLAYLERQQAAWIGLHDVQTENDRDARVFVDDIG